jgi:Transposase domain (DUF772)
MLLSMGLDLSAASFSRVEAKVTGRPGYAPADLLLKLYIYGYLNRVRSSCRLEAETHCNIEVIWLLRHLKPDFKTIADFRRDNADQLFCPPRRRLSGPAARGLLLGLRFRSEASFCALSARLGQLDHRRRTDGDA